MTTKKKQGSERQLTEQQRKLYEGMSPEAQDRAIRALAIRDQVTEGDVFGRLELGLIAVDARKAMGRTAAGKSKRGEVETLAKFLGISKNSFYDYHQVACVYDRGRIRALVSSAAEQGMEFTWSHFVRLAGVRATSLRKSLERAVIGGLTKRDLDARINEHLGRRSDGGAKFKPPKTPFEGVRQMLRALRSLVARHDMWVEHVIQPLGGDWRGLEPPRDAAEHLEELVEVVRQLSAEFGGDGDLLNEAMGKARDRLGESGDEDDEDDGQEAEAAEEAPEEGHEVPTEEPTEESPEEDDHHSSAYDDGAEYDTVTPPAPAPRRRRAPARS